MIEIFSELWGPASLLINAIVCWVIWSLRQSFAKRTDLEKLTKEVSDLSAQVEHLPTNREAHAMIVEIATLKGEMRTLDAKLSGLGRSLDRVERPLNMLWEHELKGSKK